MKYKIPSFYCRPPEAVSKRPLLLPLLVVVVLVINSFFRGTLFCFENFVCGTLRMQAWRNLMAPWSALILQLFCLVFQKHTGVGRVSEGTKWYSYDNEGNEYGQGTFGFAGGEDELNLWCADQASTNVEKRLSWYWDYPDSVDGEWGFGGHR